MKNGITDVLIVSFDSTPSESPIMIIARKTVGNRLNVINAFANKDAEDLYNLLLGGKEKYEATKKVDS